MNVFEMKLKAISANEAFARSCVAAFCVQLNPTIEEINDIKTAVSEAVTNSIVHGYESDANKYIDLRVIIGDNKDVQISVKDNGKGIADVEKAMEAFYTTKPEQERSGMGFTLMQTFMDEVEVNSAPDKGTEVIMTKYLRGCKDVGTRRDAAIN